MTEHLKLREGRYVYRPLRYRKRRRLEGWDVFALQSALNFEEGPDSIRTPLEVDGIFGTKTRRALLDWQDALGLVEDGIAGPASHRAIGIHIATVLGDTYGLPAGLPRGHLERETQYISGEYTEPYTSGVAAGSRDCGVVQRNTRFHLVANAFDVVDSLNVLCNQLVEKYEEYTGEGVKGRRAWELACGSWNAPAWTDKLAREGTLTEAQSEWIEDYMEAATVYLEK